MNKKTFLIIAISVLSVNVAWFAITPLIFPMPGENNTITAAHPGFSAPDFSLSNLQGTTISLSDYGGQPVLVIFWASWCSVCKRTLPQLQSVYLDYHSQGFEILAVNTTFQDSLTSATNYFQAQNYTFPMLIDSDGSISRIYGTHALPTSVLVDPNGKVNQVVIGAGMNESFLRSQLDQIMNSEE